MQQGNAFKFVLVVLATLGGWGLTSLQHWGDILATPAPLAGLCLLLATNIGAAYKITVPPRPPVVPDKLEGIQ